MVPSLFVAMDTNANPKVSRMCWLAKEEVHIRNHLSIA